MAPLQSTKDDTEITCNQTDCTYMLGDAGKIEDMRTFKGQNTNLYAIVQLTRNDFAFVRRSNGQWQYSKVLETSAQGCKDRFIKFQVDQGRTKTIQAHKWLEFIRLLKHTERPINTKRSTVSLNSSFTASCSSSLQTVDDVSVVKLKGRVTVDGTVRPSRRVTWDESLEDNAPVKLAEPKQNAIRRCNSLPTENDNTVKKRSVARDDCHQRSFLTALALIDCSPRSVHCKSA